MATINLVSKEEREQKQMGRARRWAYVIATAVLVGYIGAMGAIMLWWISIGNKEGTLASKSEQVGAQLSKQAKLEQTLNQIQNRLIVINQTLSGRREVATELDAVLTPDEAPVQVVAWQMDVNGNQTVSVEANSAQAIEKYANDLKSKYQNIWVKSVTRIPEAAWGGQIVFARGGK